MQAAGATPALLVLLVDDCPIQRMLTSAVLHQWGITPTLACAGEEAVRIAREQEFDLILMDIEMPGMGGFAASKRIRQIERERQRRARASIVACTGLPLPLDKVMMRRSGMNDALQKPCPASALGDCLHRWCAGKLASARMH